MKKNILVVDDSALMRRVICDIINGESTFQATDVCRDGLEAYERLRTTKYDAVLLDVNMPRMDGLELLGKLQQDKIDATVIMVSTSTTSDADVTILALERGAVDFIPKPYNIIEAKGEEFQKQLIGVLKAVLKTGNRERPLASGFSSQVKLPQTQIRPQKMVPQAVSSVSVSGKRKLIALACSTGGPKALQSVIPYLPKALDAPMILIQHMPKGFTKSMADRLDEISPIRVKEAEDGDLLEKGCVYIAPGGKHMEIAKTADGQHRVRLNEEPAIGGLRPCANITYESLAKSGYDEIICVVLTGMGADGTQGILSLKKQKRVYVVAQNAQTCVVYGMPKALVEAGVVDNVVPLTEVAQTITKNVGVR